MARDDEKRKAYWDEEEEEIPSLKKEGQGIGQRTGSIGAVDSDAVDQKIQDSKALMEQTNQLYNHYFNGIEKRPPIEKVRLLETKVKELERTTAGTTATRFKIGQFLMNYKTMKDLWERKLRDMEKK